MAADEPRWEKPQAATFACKFDVVLSQPQRDRAPVQDAVQALLVGEAHFVRALVSGSTALSASAGEALDKAIGVADAQRAGGVHRVPLVGGLLGWVVAPLAARLPYASAARRREVDEGTACAALLRLYRGALRCANGALVTGALDLRRSYVLFLGVGKDDGDPEAVAAGLARWGRGAFAAFLEFAPAAARAAFAVATASLAAVTDGDEGLRQLNAVHRSPRSLARRHAALGVALFHVAMSRRHEDAAEDALRDAYLDEGLHVLRDELRRMPDNAAAHWAASHAVRRKGDRASLAHLGACRGSRAAGVEGDGDGGRRPSLDGGPGRVAYRPRLDHAMLLCGDLRFEEARTALAPLVAAESDYGAKCMALSWIAARSSAMLAKLALPELLLMMGHLAHYARDDPHLLDLLDLYRPVQHAAEARYEPSKKNDRPREELAAACLCEGALLQCCRAACKAAKLPAKGAAAVLRERLRDAAPDDAAPKAVDVAVAAGAAVDVDAAVAADDDDAVAGARRADAGVAAAAPDDDDDDFAALLAGGDDEDYVAAALATAADAAVDGVLKHCVGAANWRRALHVLEDMEAQKVDDEDLSVDARDWNLGVFAAERLAVDGAKRAATRRGAKRAVKEGDAAAPGASSRPWRPTATRRSSPSARP
ncbi:endonuclease [Aureococcus anophagefferens]|nr:endonuclease [Aureococcus anophagefferens]